MGTTMIANQKAPARLLDVRQEHSYHSLTMARLCTAVALLALLGAGCQTTNSSTEQTLSNEQFMKLDCHGVAQAPVGMETPGEPGATNGSVSKVARTRLITPGTQITIFVAQDASLNRQFLIPPGGAIDFPPLGRFTASGLTPEELGQKIKEGLERDYFQTATVDVTAETPQVGGVIYILGRVNRPGPIALPRDEQFTMTKAMLACGGADTFGNTAKVQVIRYCEDGKKYKTFVNVQRIMERGEFEKDLPLQNGDWILVPEKIINLW